MGLRKLRRQAQKDIFSHIFKSKTLCNSVPGTGSIITINVPLFKKLRDIIFFGGENHFMSHF
jgi:hypothetical protein